MDHSMDPAIGSMSNTREKNEGMDIEEIAIPTNTLTDIWLSEPRKKKIKRLPESHEKSSSSPNLITPAINQIMRLPPGTSRSILRKTIVTFYNKSNITFLASNAIRHRHLLAREMISLKPSKGRLSRWNLGDGESNVDEDYHLDLLNKIQSCKDNHHNLHAYHSTSMKQLHEDVSYLSLVSMLHVMNAGLICTSENGIDFFVIFPTGHANARIVHIPVQKEIVTLQSNTKDGVYEQIHHNNKSINDNFDTCNRNDDLERKRLFECDFNKDCDGNDENTLTTTHRDDSYTIMDWNALSEKYAECVKAINLEPIIFVKDITSNVITSELSNVAPLNGSNPSEKCSPSFDKIIQRLRAECVLMTKAEATHSLGSMTEVQQKINFILVQVLLRIQFFVLLLQGDETWIKPFLNDFSTHMTRAQVKGSKRKPEKFTVREYTTDICSIIEMLAFVLIPPHSFSSFVKQHILLPFSNTVPLLISEIADYLELDLEDMNDSLLSKDTDHHIGTEPRSNVRQSKSTSLSISDDKSRWDFVPETHSKRNSSENQNLKDDSSSNVDERDFFQNKPDLVIKSRSNHLLKSKEKYCGGMFSTNRHVAISNSNVTAKKSKQDKNNFAREVMATPDSRSNLTTNIRNSMSNALLGRRLLISEQEEKKKIQFQKDDSSSNPHAKLIRAVVAIRKRR